jgi:glucose/arabinose dehydrogenase
MCILVRTFLLGCIALIAAATGACNHRGESSAKPQAAAPAASSQPAPARVQEVPMSDPTNAPSTAPRQQFTGTLRGGVIAIGAETTGWQLDQPDGKRVDVEVSKARDAAAANEGKRVVIQGVLTKGRWVERGEKPLIIADRIEPAGEGQ